LVSHDRYLLDKLTDQLFIMEEGGHVRIFNGNYSSYRTELEDNKQQKKSTNVVFEQKPTEKKSKLSYKEQKELDDLEKEITQVEATILEKNNYLNKADIDNSKIVETYQEIDKLKTHLENITMRWMELTELKEA